MYPRQIEVRNEVEAAAVEQALAMVRELKRLADAAPDGQVLAVVEQAAVDRGRRFVRDRLQDVLNAQADDLEKRGARLGLPLRRGAAPPRPGRAPARHRRRRRDAAPRLLRLPRLRGPRPRPGRAARRRRLRQPARPAAALPGRGRAVVREGRAGCSASSAGLVVCDNTVRKACDRHGGLMRAWQRDDPEAAPRVPRGRGGRRVPDRRDLGQHRPAAGARSGCRSSPSGERGEPVTDLDDWDEQRLPAPTARVATAGDPHERGPGAAVAAGGGAAGDQADRGDHGPGRRGQVDLEPGRPGRCPAPPACSTSTTPVEHVYAAARRCTARGRRRPRRGPSGCDGPCWSRAARRRWRA